VRIDQNKRRRIDPGTGTTDLEVVGIIPVITANTNVLETGSVLVPLLPVPQIPVVANAVLLHLLVPQIQVTTSKKQGEGNQETLGEYQKQYLATKVLDDRVQILLDIDQNLEGKYTVKTEDLTGPARTFYQRTVTKVVACIHTCHGGSVVQFSTMMAGILGSTSLFVGNKYKCTCVSRRG
jgi:hypothetical protein